MVDERQAAIEDIRHDFDARFYAGQNVIAGMRLSHFFDDIVVTEPQQHAFKSDGSQLCYSSLHKSQLDYVLLGIQLIRNGYPAPRYIAGKNLFIPHITRDYLKKCGAICLDRERVMRRDRVYIRAFSDYLRDDVLGAGENLLFFPEGGRSYDGRVGRPATGIYDSILEVCRRDDRRMRIVPIALTYDGVVEAASFPLLLRSKRMKSLWKRKLYYYVVDIGQILIQYIRNRRVCGTVYIDLLPPVDVGDYAGDRRAKVELARDVLDRQRGAVRVTARSLLATALGDAARISRTDLTDRVGNLLDEVRERGLPVTRQVSAFLEPGADRAHVVRRLVGTPDRLVEEEDGVVSARRPEVLRYYHHTTAHHFESAT
jgi:glycerol-3-phosphate O-acyltransferase